MQRLVTHAIVKPKQIVLDRIALILELLLYFIELRDHRGVYAFVAVRFLEARPLLLAILDEFLLGRVALVRGGKDHDAADVIMTSLDLIRDPFCD